MLRPKCLHSRQSITAKVKGKMMNLFKKLNVCVCVCARCLRRCDCPTTEFVYACLIEDIFLCLKFTELREKRFDNARRLNFKCICPGTSEIKLIAAIVSADVNDEHEKKKRPLQTQTCAHAHKEIWYCATTVSHWWILNSLWKCWMVHWRMSQS